MNFIRQQETTLTANLKHGFKVIIRNNNDEPDKWVISYIDYDDATGAIGIFSSEDEALTYLDSFLVLAEKLYAAKYAKYGQFPLVFLKDGILCIDISPEESEYYY